MKTVHSPDHLKRNARTELHLGTFVEPFECPERVAHILAALQADGFPAPALPIDHGLDPVLRVHDAGYVEFLKGFWPEWKALFPAGVTPNDAVPTIFPGRNMRTDRIPDDVEGRLGHYAFATETSLTETTFEAALSGANAAVTAIDLILTGDRAAFALTRPPGHHAAHDEFGGYCFFNNAAIAAQRALDAGAERVAILDIDFHHGNGTQSLFYERADVLVVNLHGHPAWAFPHFLGYGDERGTGDGLGTTSNYPMDKGTTFAVWGATLAQAIEDDVLKFRPDVLIVSLGVDTYEGDPISQFKLHSEDFIQTGAMLAAAGLPTLFVMEGGYAVADIGRNVVNVLAGFERA